jgi:hypothetical protein
MVAAARLRAASLTISGCRLSGPLATSPTAVNKILSVTRTKHTNSRISVESGQCAAALARIFLITSLRTHPTGAVTREIAVALGIAARRGRADFVSKPVLPEARGC